MPAAGFGKRARLFVQLLGEVVGDSLVQTGDDELALVGFALVDQRVATQHEPEAGRKVAHVACRMHARRAPFMRLYAQSAQALIVLP